MEKMNKYKLERLALEDAFARRMLLDYDIREVTTQKQARNGTREFQFPVTCWTKQVIKWNNGEKPTKEKLRIAVFRSGYVRKQNGAWCPYQINPTYNKTKGGCIFAMVSYIQVNGLVKRELELVVNLPE